MQISLFDWDRIETGAGLAAMAKLDFSDARKRFQLVLRSFPGHPAAGRGMRDLQYWQESLAEFTYRSEEAGLRFLWDRIRSFPFEKAAYAKKLRCSLIRHLLAAFPEKPQYFDPPELCRGYLYLQLKEYAAAETHLRSLLAELPDNGHLRLYLAEALYLQDKTEVSGPEYSKALLLAPHAFQEHEISHRNLADIVRQYGPLLTPIYAFFKGVLPLVKHDPLPDTQEIRMYKALQWAEKAKRDGSHPEMIAARRDMKNLSGEIFQDYMEVVQVKKV